MSIWKQLSFVCRLLMLLIEHIKELMDNPSTEEAPPAAAADRSTK